MAYIAAGDTGRVCDKCGRYRPRSKMRRVGGQYVCDLHPSWTTREQLEGLPHITIGGVEPVKDAKPYNPRDTFEADEAEVLRFILQHAPADTIDFTHCAGVSAAGAVQGAAWAAIYLYELIAEDRRPAVWLEAARAKLLELGDWLVANQASTTTSALGYGGYNRATSGETYYSADSGAAGLALLRAYQVHGKERHLVGARACAWFLRGAQCGDKLTTFPSSSDSAGATVKAFGMWTHEIRLNGVTYNFDHRYYPGDLVGLEFLVAYKAAIGDETIGSATVTAPFNASREATVSAAIAAARTFWETAQQDADAGATVKGFSTATPREFFDAYPANKGLFTGRGAWQFQDGTALTGTLISASSWAAGIRAMRSLDGDSSFVTGAFDWLAAFTDSGTYALPARDADRLVTGYDDPSLYRGALGAFDAKVAPTTLLAAATQREGSPIYDLAALGLLAALYSARQQATFRETKRQLGLPRPRYLDGHAERHGKHLYLAILGRCGLSYQPITDTSLNREASVARAAQVGLAYRQAPKAFTMSTDPTAPARQGGGWT